jgi:hypothetical protein
MTQFRARNLHEPNSISHQIQFHTCLCFQVEDYIRLRRPFLVNDLSSQKTLWDRRLVHFPPFFVIPLPRALRFIFAQVYSLLQQNDIPVPFHVTMSRDVCYPLKLQPILCIQMQPILFLTLNPKPSHHSINPFVFMYQTPPHSRRRTMPSSSAASKYRNHLWKRRENHFIPYSNIADHFCSLSMAKIMIFTCITPAAPAAAASICFAKRAMTAAGVLC